MMNPYFLTFSRIRVRLFENNSRIAKFMNPLKSMFKFSEEKKLGLSWFEGLCANEPW